MTSKINNVSDVFREAKKHLWNGRHLRAGVGGWEDQKGTQFICHAIEDLTDLTSTDTHLTYKAKKIIQYRLGEDSEGDRTVTCYLQRVLGIPRTELTNVKVQKYRRDWLTALEKEFAPKLKPKKGFAIHHIDGDINNNEPSNLTYVRSAK